MLKPRGHERWRPARRDLLPTRERSDRAAPSVRRGCKCKDSFMQGAGDSRLAARDWNRVPSPRPQTTCSFPRLVFRKTSTPALAASTKSQSPQHLLYGTPVAPEPQTPMKTIIQDLKYAFRGLAKNPGFTAMAIFTVALGVGANTAIFSVVKAVLLNQLPYRQPDRLVMVAESDSFSVR